MSNLGEKGLTARKLLKWIANEQYRGKKVTLAGLRQWAEKEATSDILTNSLYLLYERFLIVNHDPKRGNFAVFPSLAEFLQQY